MNIYLIPGLGFDCRIYQNLQLPYPNIHHLNWIEPKKNETLSSYADRMGKEINDTISNIIIGHSLGGIIAQEIANLKKIDAIFIISSIQSEKENPLQFRIFRYLGLHRLFSKEMTLFTFPFWAKQHGYTTQYHRELFKDMVSKHSNHYLQWALLRLAQWKKSDTNTITTIHQIVGDRDKNFPIQLIQQADVIISGGTHFMVFKKPEIISSFIQEKIDGIYHG